MSGEVISLLKLDTLSHSSIETLIKALLRIKESEKNLRVP
jgi:hypothetical protein